MLGMAIALGRGLGSAASIGVNAAKELNPFSSELVDQTSISGGCDA